MRRWHCGISVSRNRVSTGAVRRSRWRAICLHHYSLALALVFAAWLHQFRQEPRAAREHAEAAIAICAEQGFPLFMAMGSDSARLGHWFRKAATKKEAPTDGAEGLADLRATGAALWQPTFLSLIAEADGRIGQAERGLRLLGEGMAMVERNDERFYEAELHRLKGEPVAEIGVRHQLRQPQPVSGADIEQAIAVGRDRNGSRHPSR